MPTVQEVKFRRKTTAEIEDLEIEDGALIYNVENGKTYMDYGNERIQTGGNADTMIYVGDEEPTDEDIKLWIETPISETKASEIVNEYTESDKVGYSTEYANNNFQIKGTILYSNDNPSDNSDIPLTDTLNNYSTFEIFGKFHDNFFTENFGAKFLTSTSINERIIINGGRPITNGIANYKAIYVVNSDSLTFTNLGQLASTNSGNQAKTDGKIKIYKVIGYKF